MTAFTRAGGLESAVRSAFLGAKAQRAGGRVVKVSRSSSILASCSTTRELGGGEGFSRQLVDDLEQLHLPVALIEVKAESPGGEPGACCTSLLLSRAIAQIDHDHLRSDAGYSCGGSKHRTGNYETE